MRLWPIVKWLQRARLISFKGYRLGTQVYLAKDAAVAEAHMEMGYLSGLYSRLVIRIGLEKADKDFRNAFLAMR